MFRLWYLTFFGESRSEDHSHHPHESPWSMLSPLVILAVLSIIGGWVGIERFGNFLSPVTGPIIDPALEPGGKSLDITLSIVAVAVAAVGWAFARLYYGRKSERPGQTVVAMPGVYSLLTHKYWIDELYSNTIVKPLTLASSYILGWLGEGAIIRGSAWLLAGIATLLGELVRRWQSGNLRSYSAWLAAGAAVLLVFAIASALFGFHSFDFAIAWAGR
jgi:NADH-quinone oxidoreductase subunit L